VIGDVPELPPHPANSNSDPTNRRRFMPLPWLRPQLSRNSPLDLNMKDMVVVPGAENCGSQRQRTIGIHLGWISTG
jgi:hypothetical protein